MLTARNQRPPRLSRPDGSEPPGHGGQGAGALAGTRVNFTRGRTRLRVVRQKYAETDNTVCRQCDTAETIAARA